MAATRGGDRLAGDLCLLTHSVSPEADKRLSAIIGRLAPSIRLPGSEPFQSPLRVSSGLQTGQVKVVLAGKGRGCCWGYTSVAPRHSITLNGSDCDRTEGRDKPADMRPYDFVKFRVPLCSPVEPSYDAILLLLSGRS